MPDWKGCYTNNLPKNWVSEGEEDVGKKVQGKAKCSASLLSRVMLSWNQYSNLFIPEITSRPLYMFLSMWNEENLWGLWNCTSNRSKSNLGLNITIKLNETLIDSCVMFFDIWGRLKRLVVAMVKTREWEKAVSRDLLHFKPELTQKD